MKLAIDVIDASADFMYSNMRIIMVPILHFIITLIFLIIWIGAVGCVISMNDIKINTTIPQTKSFEFESKFNFYAVWYMIFGACWIVSWISYTSKFVVQVSAVTFYFGSNPEKEEDGEVNIGKGLKFAYLNYMGSIAFGALIIRIVRFIKLVFIYAARSASKAGGDNAFIKMVVKCGMCYLSCLEKICDYINSSAYAYMAVSG